MFNPGIHSSDRTTWVRQQERTSVPSLDYEALAGLLKTSALEPEVVDAIEDGTVDPTDTKVTEQPTPEAADDATEAGYTVRDLRKSAKGYSVDDMVDNSKHVHELEENSIVPIPGMMVNYEDDDASEAPITSDWIAPQGPFWSNYTNT